MNAVNEMHAAVIRYFMAEKRESLFFLLIGGAALAVSVLFWLTDSPIQAMGWPLSAVAVIQIVVGWTVFTRTDRQVLTLHALLARDPQAFAAAELPRMHSVRRSFRFYFAAEVILLAAGVLGVWLLRDRPALYAVSLGLGLQAGLMLILDLIAERRAEAYVARIRPLAGG